MRPFRFVNRTKMVFVSVCQKRFGSSNKQTLASQHDYFFLVHNIYSWTLIQKRFNRSSRWWDQIEIVFFFESWKKKTEIYSAFWVIYVPLYDCDVTNFVLEILNVLNTSKKNSMNFWRISLVLSCLLRFFNKEMFGHLLWIHETLIKFASVEWYKTVHQLT